MRLIQGSTQTSSRALALLAVATLADVSSTQQFVPGQVLAGEADHAVSLHAADMDGDGDLDALSASELDDKIAWYENVDGLGSFGPQRVISTQALLAQAVFAADLDGDGDQDVLSASYVDDKIAWYENVDGLGTFGPLQIITNVAHGAQSVFAADLDGDGDPDVLSASSEDDGIAWYENVDGLGTFGPLQIITSVAHGARSVFTADLDGDGDPDVLSASYEDDKIAWYENVDGLGTFGSQEIISISATGAQSVVASDLDGDGDQDVLSASFSDDQIAWYENTDGLGSFGPERVVSSVANGARSVVAADLDGDGDQDVLSASSEDDRVAWYKNTNGLGSFGPQKTISTAADGAWQVQAADVDGDGDQDVLSASATDGKIAWYRNTNSLGDFGSQKAISSTVEGARAVFAADLDGDGDRDVLSASFVDDKLAWYENVDGLGGFGPQQVVSTAANGPQSLFAADLDGDQDQDVLLGSALDDRVSWFENIDGSGGFGPQQLVSSAVDEPRSVLAADLDGDGDLEILSASRFDNKIAWYENVDGLGSFGPQQVISSAASGALSVFAADLDGDGDRDVLSASSIDDKIAWYENSDGLGTFGPQEVISTSADAAASVFAADLDGDGDQDVLSASSGAAKIAWYRNNDGLGAFASEKGISFAANGAVSVFAVDLDGDGDRDVVGGSSNTITWHENVNGSGEFAEEVVTTVQGGIAQWTFAADLDGDGDQDVLSAAASSFIDKIAWFENKACCSLAVGSDTLSLIAGGTQVCTLDAGVVKALDLYWILSTNTGASLGLALATSPLKLPLNWSPLLLSTALNPSLLLASSHGLLDGAGQATATLTLPAGLDPGLAGMTLHHAYLVLDAATLEVTGISNAVALKLVP